jgi:membrane protease YdiL (CAAX protease family)
MGGFFLGLTVIYAAMVVLAARQGRGMLSALKASLREGVGPLFSNTFFVTLISIGFLGFTILVIDTIETSGGIPVGSISGDPMQLFMSLTIAPLREEIGFRLVMVGIPAVALCLGGPWRQALKSLWRPSAAYEGDVNTTSQQFVLAVATAVSSFFFGLAHITSGAGWQIGKLPEAAFAGAVLCYVYIKYGLHVAVLTHWGIDYMDSVYAFFGQGAYGIPWSGSTSYVLQTVTALDLVAFLGLASFLAVCYVGLKSLTRRWGAGAPLLGGQS